MRTLLIDKYDSYTFNLFHLLVEVNHSEPVLVRNDELTWDELAGLNADKVVSSPGPGRPEHTRDRRMASGSAPADRSWRRPIPRRSSRRCC